MCTKSCLTFQLESPLKAKKKKKAFAQFGLESGMVLRELRE